MEISDGLSKFIGTAFAWYFIGWMIYQFIAASKLPHRNLRRRD